METACLRIKFTPLLQKNPKNNSKCCLEIVPEVSCLQNLDKLTWRQETNFIEYTIPMTYKVIVKKRQAIKDVSDDTVKTYHSCVDLLLTSSKSTLDLGSGDVSKIISDTFILHKAINNTKSKQHFTNALTDGNKDSKNIIRNYAVSYKSTCTSMPLEDIDGKEVTNTKDDKVEPKTKISENIILEEASLNKITNTENMYPVFSETLQSGNASILTAPDKNSVQNESRRLSLSPICSLSTQENPFMNKIVVSKAITCKIYDSHKDLGTLGILETLGSSTTPSDLSHDTQTHNTLSAIIDISSQQSSKRLRFKCRVPPEMRVLEYVQFIEKEILPMKLLLNDIMCKCSALGLSLCKKTSKQSLMFKSVTTCSESADVTKYEEYAKSNRVIYSIVFDG